MSPALIEIRQDNKFFVVYVKNIEVSRQKSLVKATQKLAAYVKSQPQIGA